MILYFTGTGNSQYLANEIGGALQDEVVSINGKLKNLDNTSLYSENPWIFVLPTYGWKIPNIVENWIQKTDFKGSKQVYFMMTCGGEIGNAQPYLQELIQQKNLEFMGVEAILMPDNYIVMFDGPSREETESIIAKSYPDIQKAIALIKMGKGMERKKVSLADKMKSSVINKAFYKLYVKTDKFYAKNNCIACGKCVELCPLNNISLKNNLPSWGTECTHCMACICKCPVEAIEYGKKTIGKKRYSCPR